MGHHTPLELFCVLIPTASSGAFLTGQSKKSIYYIVIKGGERVRGLEDDKARG